MGVPEGCRQRGCVRLDLARLELGGPFLYMNGLRKQSSCLEGPPISGGEALVIGRQR